MIARGHGHVERKMRALAVFSVRRVVERIALGRAARKVDKRAVPVGFARNAMERAVNDIGLTRRRGYFVEQVVFPINNVVRVEVDVLSLEAFAAAVAARCPRRSRLP